MAYIENSTHFGISTNEIIWNPDFEASRDEKGKWTGSESFTCKLKYVTQLLPAIGASCQMDGFSFLKFTSCKVENIEGDLAQVTCEYSGYSETDFAFDENNLNNYTYDLQIYTSVEPVETFHKFYIDYPIGDADWILIRNFNDGSIIPHKSTPNTFTLPNEFNNTSVTVGTLSSQGGIKLYNSYLKKGNNTYEEARQVFRVSYTSLTKPPASKYNDVGKIVEPPDAPAVAGGRTWLFKGMTVTETDKLFTITEEYELSELGGWDTFLYGDATL